MSYDSLDDIPIIILPGTGADRRCYLPQIEAFGGAIIAEHLDPEPDESLDDYARRVAGKYDPGCSCYLVGHSFGGIIAPKVARHMDVKAVFLIASIRGSRELPVFHRIFSPLILHCRPGARLLLRFIQLEMRFALFFFPWAMSSAQRSVAGQFLSMPIDWFYWATRHLLAWDESRPESYPYPVYQIHGAWDMLLSYRRTSPDVVIPRAGHLITLSHADEVNAFIREKIEAIEAGGEVSKEL